MYVIASTTHSGFLVRSVPVANPADVEYAPLNCDTHVPFLYNSMNDALKEYMVHEGFMVLAVERTTDNKLVVTGEAYRSEEGLTLVRPDLTSASDEVKRGFIMGKGYHLNPESGYYVKEPSDEPGVWWIVNPKTWTFSKVEMETGRVVEGPYFIDWS